MSQHTEQQNNKYQRGLLAGLSPNVVLLGWVSFFGDVSSEMLYPLIPIFLTTVLGAPVALVGVIEGIAEAVASIMKPLAGRWSDASGKRRLYMLQGYSLSACAKAILALAYTWPVALVGRAVDRLGKGLRTGSRDALLAESVARSNLGKALGFHRGMDTMGAVVGPLLALLLLKVSGDSLRLVLWLAVIPGLISAAIVLLAREQRRTANALKVARTAGTLPSQFKFFLMVWGIFAFTNSSDVFLLLKAKNLGLATVGVVLLYALYNLAYAVASPALGRLSDILGRGKLLVSGLVVFGLVYCGFAMASSTTHLIILFAAYGLYMAATEGVSKAFAIDLVPVSAKATASGWLGMVTGIGALIASCTAGVLWDHVGTWAVFALGAGGALCAAMALMVLASPHGKIA
jgi:MFS family permease